MQTFKINFRALDQISPNHIEKVEAEHADDIEVAHHSDNMDPSVYNSSDWYITPERGGVVLRNSPDTTIDIWR